MHAHESYRSPAELRLLLVEDDPDVVNAIRDGFAQCQVALYHAPTVADGRRLLARELRFHAVILDLSLPDGDGATLVEPCRESGHDIPIIMVTAKDTVGERIAGLQRGADDYLCKPFAVEELSARLDAVLRRTRRKVQHVLKYGDLELDLLRRRVRRFETEVTLSVRELDLLAYLMCHPEEVLSKDRILREVWGDEAEQDSNVLHVYANYLRNKLERDTHGRIIHTVRGVGYILSREHPSDGPLVNGRSAD